MFNLKREKLSLSFCNLSNFHYLCRTNQYQAYETRITFKGIPSLLRGFRTMTLGKTLWTIILIKLAIIFLVLKLFFFPDYIDSKAPNKDKADFVSHEMLKR